MQAEEWPGHFLQLSSMIRIFPGQTAGAAQTATVELLCYIQQTSERIDSSATFFVQDRNHSSSAAHRDVR
jgi:hypothetical protein